MGTISLNELMVICRNGQDDFCLIRKSDIGRAGTDALCIRINTASGKYIIDILQRLLKFVTFEYFSDSGEESNQPSFTESRNLTGAEIRFLTEEFCGQLTLWDKMDNKYNFKTVSGDIMELTATKLKTEDYLEFCKICLCKNRDMTEGAMSLAYHDMQRTIHGIGHFKRRDKMKSDMREDIKSAIDTLLSSNSDIISQDRFDRWHRELADKLIETVKRHVNNPSENEDGKAQEITEDTARKKPDIRCSYGQAQKWINMTLKYLSVFEHDTYKAYYPYFHVPLDKYVLTYLEKDRNFVDTLSLLQNGSDGDDNKDGRTTGKKLSEIMKKGKADDFAWSRWDDYDEYMMVQEAFRQTYSDEIPLDKEFEIWNTAASKNPELQ